MTTYERLEVIGRGQQGLVYRAYDVERDRHVALKALHGLDPESVYRLKREFRALAHLTHPNLVELYDLVVSNDEHFFTMELIDGVDLITWARAHAGEPTRIVGAARQLVAAIAALHDGGCLHRDVKPSNVLVEAEGRVVVCDFGLVATMAADASSEAGYLIGTLPYMAPEQVWGGAPTPAADWHMVGATLYEALCGSAPFSDEALQARLAGSLDDPPPPSARGGPSVPSLETLIMRLLAFEPGERPNVAEIVRHLDGETSARGPAPASVRLIGRDRELAALDAAWHATAANGLVRVDVHGPSGIGKTALVEHFVSATRGAIHAIVLRGRCHPQESVPFKAVDGIIDELTQLLAREPRDAIDRALPADAAALVRLFPVLGRLESFARAAEGTAVEGEPHEIRRRALAALRTLLSRVGHDAPLVLWIDDVQWSDLDSVAVLRELQRGEDAPRALLLLSYRAEDRAASEPLRALTEEPSETTHDTIALGPLSTDDACALAAEELAAAERPRLERPMLEAIAADAAGSPFFVGELVRHIAARNTTAATQLPGIVEVLQQRIESLPPDRRRILDLLAVAGRPIDEGLAATATGVDDAWSELIRLRRTSLVRTTSDRHGPTVTIYHDRIRDAVLQLIPVEARRALHHQIAGALAARPNADPLLLVDHYLQADDPDAAAHYAYASAERAEAALAFDQAARLFARALELQVEGPRPWEIRARLAATLVNDGRGADAAAHYLAAARELEQHDPHNLDVIRLGRNAADQYLRSGYVEEGFETLQAVLGAVDLWYAPSTRRALLALVMNRARLAIARWMGGEQRGPVDPLAQERLEVCWTAGLGVSVFDSIRGAEFQVRHAMLAHVTGDASHRARSLSTEAVIAAMEGGRRKQARAATLLAEGQAMARTSGDSRAEAHACVMSAGVAFFDQRYREVLARCEEGDALCRTQCVGSTWERANMDFLYAYSLAYLGELQQLRARLPAMLDQARDLGDHFALTNYRIGMIPLAWLAADAPGEARWQVTDAIEGRTPHRSAWQHYMGTYALVLIDLYESHPDVAARRLRRLKPMLRRAQMLRLQTVRTELALLEARCDLALAAIANTRGDHNAVTRHLQRAKRARRHIAREDARWATPLADSLGGASATIEGNEPEALRLLDAASAGFRRIDLRLHAAAATLQAANITGQRRGIELDGPGAGFTCPADWMREQAVEQPRRLAGVLVPCRL